MELFTNSSSMITGISNSSNSSMRRLKAMEVLAMANHSEMALPPICTVDFHNPDIRANKAELSSFGAYYNKDYGNSWLLHHPGQSYLQVATDIDKDPKRSYSLDLVHLSSLVNGQPLAQITIEVNGQVVTTGYNPNNGNYVRDSFDITKYIVDGKNEVRIRFDSTSKSNYWIQSLAIQAK